MELLQKAIQYGASAENLKLIYFSYIRSQLEQTSTLWHSSLTVTQQNSNDLERIQKTAIKIILRNQYNGYDKSLIKLDMEKLLERRESLCLKYAINSLKNEKMKRMFPLNENLDNKRKKEIYFVQHANTERLRKSSIIYMQNLLNKYQKDNF